MIEILKNEKDFIEFHEQNQDKTIGFVPTMGNLHKGHISLLEASFQDNDISIISIFVNPTQFGEHEDLDAYPRTFEDDLNKIKDLHTQYSSKEVYVFFPESDKVIYPEGFSDYISIPALNSVIEGEVRPTHFDGVATVVKRLFNIVKPHRAYFGKKDYQQLRLVEKLVDQESLSVNIIGLPIVREQDGLAMSSRNNYLNKEQREEALHLNRKLKEISSILSQEGLEAAANLAQKTIDSDSRFNYIEIRKQSDLTKPSLGDKKLVLLGNLQIGTTRLLDNIEVNI
jgi:pantoate--beta-alanine ligase